MILRYSLQNSFGDWLPLSDDDGEWVDFEDHQLAMMASDAAIRELQRQLAEARALITDVNCYASVLPDEARFAIESYLEETK